MKKVLYGFILVLCLAGGLGVGIMRQKWHANGGGGSDVVLTDPNEAQTPDATATDTTMSSGSMLADATMTPMDGSMAAATDTPVAMTTSTEPSAGDMTGRTDDPAAAASNRSFGGTDSGSTSTVSTHSSWDSSSSGTTHTRKHSSSSSSDVSMSDPVPRGTPVPKNQVRDSSDFGTETFDTSADTGSTSSSKKHTAKATPEPTAAPADPVDDLPVVDDGTDTAAATPEPAQTKVASIAPAMSSGGGELTFPAGNGGAYLKKVTQRQNGDKTIVHIDFAGDARYRVFRVKNPNRVLVDFEETAVPGGDPQPVSGSAQHVKEISARELKNAGGLPIARVQIVLTDGDAVPNVSNEATKGGVDVVIGGGDKF